VAVGLAVAFAVYVAGPFVAALAGWLGGFLAAVAVQAVIILRQVGLLSSGDDPPSA
jgi:hypothetical protein